VIKQLATLGILCLGVACAGPSGPPTQVTDTHTLSGGTIAVVEFDQSNANIHYNGPHDTFGLVLAEEIASRLSKLGHNAKAVPAAGRHEAQTVVTGRITRIEGGSRATRYWVGFGAGAAKVGVVGSVREGNRELARFSHERWSGFGVFGGASASLLQKCLRAIGADVAKMIDTGQYTGVE
jgi:hypothetical protein